MIGERLKEIRLNRKKKQRELADAVGVQTSMISRYETNRDDPTDRVKVEIARFLGVSLDYLLGLIKDPVTYYDQKTFVIFDEALPQDSMDLLEDFIGFLKHRNTKLQ